MNSEDCYNPKLYMRALVPAKFLIAVKRYERGDLEGCRQALKETCGLYEQDQIAVMPCEYFLAESWLAELEGRGTEKEPSPGSRSGEPGT